MVKHDIVKGFEYYHLVQRLSQKIVHFVIKEPNLVHRYFKSCLLNLEWVPPKFKRCCTKTINYKFANQSICEAINELIKNTPDI